MHNLYLKETSGNRADRLITIFIHFLSLSHVSVSDSSADDDFSPPLWMLFLCVLSHTHAIRVSEAATGCHSNTRCGRRPISRKQNHQQEKREQTNER